MPYVQRNSQNKITALFAEPCYPAQEFLREVDPQVQAFVQDKPSSELAGDERETLIHVLSASDLESIRIIDDLVALLVRSNTIRYTDLPAAAQKKLMSRQQAREQLSELPDLIDADEPLF